MSQQSYSYRVPLGPNNPALKEPVSFNFEVEGEKVVDVTLKPGWTHRGIEYLATKRNAVQVIYLAERICGICSITHALNFVRAVEDAADLTVPLRGEYIRTIAAELERIHSHVLWAGFAGHVAGFDSLFYYAWNIREKVMDVLEALTGNRVNYGILAIGGVRRDITPEIAEVLRDCVKYYKDAFGKLRDACLEDPTVKMRTRDVGILTQKDAIELSAVGPTVRASGLPIDVRQYQPYCAYGDLGFEAVTPQAVLGEYHGDVYDKILVRVYEVAQSVDIIEKCLDALPEGPYTLEPKTAKLLALLKAKEGEGISSIEGPRGEDYHHVRLTGNDDNITAMKVRAPTYANMISWIPMLKGYQLADVPLIVASVDPCMSCTDRVTVVDRQRGKSSILTNEMLTALSIEKTRRMMR